MFVPFDLTIPFAGIYDNEITTKRGVYIFNFKNVYDSIAYHIKKWELSKYVKYYNVINMYWHIIEPL